MKFLPFENITYQTKLTSEEILKRLNENIEPKKTFRMKGIFGKSDHKPYEGSIQKNSFAINRVLEYRNSFSPNIAGVIEQDLSGTKIEVKMRLHALALVFMAVWCGILALVFLAFLIASTREDSFEPAMLIPLGMLVFGYVLTTAGFKYESARSKKFLAELFEATIEE